MTKKEVRAKAREMLDGGALKKDVFTALQGQGVKDKLVALYIAEWLAPELKAKWQWLAVTLAIVILALMCLNALTIYALMAHELSHIPAWGVLILAAIFALLLTIPYGIARCRHVAFLVFIVLSIVGLTRSFRGGVDVYVLIGVAVSIGMIAAVFFAKSKLWPDMGFNGPPLVNGQYKFTERAVPDVSSVFS